MNRTILLTLLALISSLVVTAQEPQNLYTIDSNNRITTDSCFLRSRYDNSIDTLKCTREAAYATTLGKSRYIVEFSSYDLYKKYDEGGDFGVITVRRNGKVVYEYRTNDWLLRFDGELCALNESIKRESKNGLFIEVPLSPTSKALIFDAWGFSEQPPLTILLLTEDDVRVVHNRQMGIVSVERSGENFSMTLQSNIQESPSETAAKNPPTLHTIWAEGGKLLFRNNHVELPMWGTWQSLSSDVDLRLCLEQNGDKIYGYHTTTYQVRENRNSVRTKRTIDGVVRDSVAQITIHSDDKPLRAEIKYLNADSMSFQLLTKNREQSLPRKAVLRRTHVNGYFDCNPSDNPLNGKWVKLTIYKDGDTVRYVHFGTSERYVDFNLKSGVIDLFTGHESAYYNILNCESNLLRDYYTVTQKVDSKESHFVVELINSTLMMSNIYGYSGKGRFQLYTSTPERYRLIMETD